MVDYILSLFSATKAERDSTHSANEAILSALERRGPDALDVLIESLEAEEDVNQHVIEKIRKGKFLFHIHGESNTVTYFIYFIYTRV